MPGTTDRRGRGRQLLWFAGLWAAGLAAVAALAYGLRFLMGLL